MDVDLLLQLSEDTPAVVVLSLFAQSVPKLVVSLAVTDGIASTLNTIENHVSRLILFLPPCRYRSR